MIIVLVLMISCQGSDQPKSGPLTAQITMAARAAQKVEARPACAAVHCAILSKRPLRVGMGDELSLAASVLHGLY